MRSTILAVILIVAAGAAHARPIPGLAGNAGRMPETMSPGLEAANGGRVQSVRTYGDTEKPVRSSLELID